VRTKKKKCLSDGLKKESKGSEAKSTEIADPEKVKVAEV